VENVEATSHGKVLVMDDDPDIVRLIRVVLKVHGWDVVEASTGMKGFRLARAESPDIILLDVMMPDANGFEVYRWLKIDPETYNIPIIFVSANSGKEHVQRGLSLGASGYITKPFHPPDLIAAIQSIAATPRLKKDAVWTTEVRVT